MIGPTVWLTFPFHTLTICLYKMLLVCGLAFPPAAGLAGDSWRDLATVTPTAEDTTFSLWAGEEKVPYWQAVLQRPSLAFY